MLCSARTRTLRLITSSILDALSTMLAALPTECMLSVLERVAVSDILRVACCCKGATRRRREPAHPVCPALQTACFLLPAVGSCLALNRQPGRRPCEPRRNARAVQRQRVLEAAGRSEVGPPGGGAAGAERRGVVEGLLHKAPVLRVYQVSGSGSSCQTDQPRLVCTPAARWALLPLTCAHRPAPLLSHAPFLSSGVRR